jgi:uncharacterized protein YjbI with pentapeptide repeats
LRGAPRRQGAITGARIGASPRIELLPRKHAKDATLRAYLDQMSGLMLDKKLLTSKGSDGVSMVARTVTLTALHRLNGERRAALVRFLFEAKLLKRGTPLVSLQGADLREASLRDANLADANLVGANLVGADLRNAFLERADLSIADLRGADLAEADLACADLTTAHLKGANLRGAYLDEVYLVGEDLRGADLRGAHLEWAYLGLEDNAGNRQEGALPLGLDLRRFITELPPERQKEFLDLQDSFLTSLTPGELAKLNLSREELAKFRREAAGRRQHRKYRTPTCA